MIKIFNSNISNGPMSGKKDFYSDTLSREEIIKDLKIRRQKLGKLKGFDGNRLIVPLVTNRKPFTYHDITEEVGDLLNEYPEYDLWDLDIPCDIMIVRSNLKGVVLSYPVADCPVVVVSSKDTIGIAHCSSEMIDKELPISLVDAVSKVSKAKDSELSAYIGPCAGYNYVYETYPRWATNPEWNYFIEETDKGYRIDIRRAVMSQLMKRNIKFVTTSTIDTISDPSFYSNYAYKHGDESKKGRFLVGAYFDKEKVKTR
ncbi:MAG: laccase domain-containing protein [Bacilli bacterium]|nr:laccase domain-containing protein [Bacilli bacterium]